MDKLLESNMILYLAPFLRNFTLKLWDLAVYDSKTVIKALKKIPVVLITSSSYRFHWHENCIAIVTITILLRRNNGLSEFSSITCIYFNN